MNIHTKRVMQEHNQRVERAMKSKKGTKEKLQKVLLVFDETIRQLGGRRKG